MRHSRSLIVVAAIIATAEIMPGFAPSAAGLGKLCHTQTTCRCSDNAVQVYVDLGNYRKARQWRLGPGRTLLAGEGGHRDQMAAALRRADAVGEGQEMAPAHGRAGAVSLNAHRGHGL
jgi:hypothetical protein